ncbi:MAG: hypothetical protein L0229_21245 [Blastocatellia bacterium]|nr:hypothetical protein [Blastocatellia bacterium]
MSEKLGALCAAAAILPLGLASLLVLYQTSSMSRAARLDRLRDHARSAARLYDKRLVEMQSAAQQLAGEIANRSLVADDSEAEGSKAAWARLQDMLPRAQNEFGLDFVIVTDPAGRVIARHNDRPAADETVLAADNKNPVAEKAISNGSQLLNRAVASCVVERGQQIARLGLDLRAKVERPDKTVLSEALIIEAGAPIIGAGRFVGVVLIGQMINNFSTAPAGATSLRAPLVAEARQAIYPGADNEAGALIALGDTVIASSVPAKDKARGPAGEGALLGVRCDSSKTEQADMLREGERDYAVWWQPIKSLDGAAPAAIGAAVPAAEIEGPSSFRMMLIVICALAFLLSAAVGFLFGRSLGARLDALRESADRMSVGELSTAVKDRDVPPSGLILGFFARDEISRLAEQLDQMRESFRQAIDRMRKR